MRQAPPSPGQQFQRAFDLSARSASSVPPQHYDFLSSSGLIYGQNLVRAGPAHLPEGASSHMDNLQIEAQAAGVGHWTTCAGYGT